MESFSILGCKGSHFLGLAVVKILNKGCYLNMIFNWGSCRPPFTSIEHKRSHALSSKSSLPGASDPTGCNILWQNRQILLPHLRHFLSCQVFLLSHYSQVSNHCAAVVSNLLCAYCHRQGDKAWLGVYNTASGIHGCDACRISRALESWGF